MAVELSRLERAMSSTIPVLRNWSNHKASIITSLAISTLTTASLAAVSQAIEMDMPQTVALLSSIGIVSAEEMLFAGTRLFRAHLGEPSKLYEPAMVGAGVTMMLVTSFCPAFDRLDTLVLGGSGALFSAYGMWRTASLEPSATNKVPPLLPV